MFCPIAPAPKKIRPGIVCPKSSAAEFGVGFLTWRVLQYAICMTEDIVQLRQFVENGDEAAFGQLVSRHFNVVYGTALRLANGDASLAQDVAQTVFTDLARKARFLPGNIRLAGWLHQAARFSAAKAVRTEQRRRAREKAFAMNDLLSEPPREPEQLRPLLDAALARLNAKDRDAVLLHFFEQKNFRAVGAALGLSDDAAQKRVGRALSKLRTILLRSGVPVSASSLSGFLSAAVPSVPAGLASAVANTSLAKAGAMGPSSWIKMFMENLLAAKSKVAAAGLVVLLLSASGVYIFHPLQQVKQGSFISVDLSGYYNGGLDQSWTPAYGNNNLAALGEGRRVLKGIPFDIHGVVQLQGAEWKKRGYNYPETVEGIAVNTTGRRIHLLHATSAIADSPGTPVAALILHYADGAQTRFDIHQGVEALDWWDWPRASITKPAGSNTTVAWTGSNLAAQHQGARIRLFDTVFMNPYPETEIQSVDYDSAMAGSAPFMVGLTVER
jgi:RNA polymerase sigma factor (sigma-70 family)